MKTLNQILKWTPRFLGILFIIIVTPLAFDVFGQGTGFWKTLAGFLLHLIPSFVLILLLVSAWKWPLSGGTGFIILGILYIVWSSGTGRGADFIYITLFVTGLLFFASWLMKKVVKN